MNNKILIFPAFGMISLIVLALVVGRYLQYKDCYYSLTQGTQALEHSAEEFASYCWESRFKFPFGSYSPERT